MTTTAALRSQESAGQRAALHGPIWLVASRGFEPAHSDGLIARLSCGHRRRGPVVARRDGLLRSVASRIGAGVDLRTFLARCRSHWVPCRVKILRYHAVVPSRTIFHPYGVKAEVDIQPRQLAEDSSAKQTVHIQVYKTCESMEGWCHASAVNGWMTFDAKQRWDHFLDLDDARRSRWGKWTLGPIVCLIALAAGIAVPQQEPETVTVKLEVRDASGKQVFSASDALINLTVR